MKKPVRGLGALICIGALLRLVVAMLFQHESVDLESTRIVITALQTNPLDVYATQRWPYPPGYLPVLLAADWLAKATGVPYQLWLHFPVILADALLTLVVYRLLLLKGASTRQALAASSLVAVGPTFLVTTGYTIQIDSVAILPAAFALLVWETPGLVHRRALIAGLLIGIGAVLKTVPLLVAAGLLPTARSLRERLALVGVAVTLPAISVAPWVLHDMPTAARALRYGGVPCVGGVSVLIQPEVTKWVIAPRGPVSVSRLTELAVYWTMPVVALMLIALAAILYVRKVEAPRACAVLWLTFFAITPNFFFQYLVWGLPFFLMAGGAVAVAVAEVGLLLPHVVFETKPWEQSWIGWLYVVFMIAAWLGTAAAFMRIVPPILFRAPVTRLHSK